MADFHQLADIGLFSAAHMNDAIYQFRRFEITSLEYALDDDERAVLEGRPVQVYAEDPVESR